MISQPRGWISWASVSVLAILCCVLGFLQYRSIGQITAAERTRLYGALQSKLNAAAREFNNNVAAACLGLIPRVDEIDSAGAERAYGQRYASWQSTHGNFFRRVGLVLPRAGDATYLSFDSASETFAPSTWPENWEPIRFTLTQRIRNDGRGRGPQFNGLVFEFPRFGEFNAPNGREQEWLLVELNIDYLRDTMLPEVLDKHLSEQGKLEYDVSVVNAREPSHVVYKASGGRDDVVPSNADASVPLLADMRPNQGRRGGPGGPGRIGPGRGGPDRGGPDRGGFPDGPPPGLRMDARGPNGFRGPGGPGMTPDGVGLGGGRWLLLVRNRAGSLESLVRQSQRWNLAISASILALIVATGAMLVRFSRQAQHLAELQINFVAGVSHEFRTPLTVMRTAAYNLRTARISSLPDQVERYGKLIETESEKLEKLVEDVMRFASAKAGHVIRDREPVEPAKLVDKAIESRRLTLESSGVVFEQRIPSSLPVVLADGLALRHVIQNLLDNALKYGTEGGNWIGVYVEAVDDERGASVQIRVCDRGPGIPADEMSRLFDPFFRGRRALQDQIHGTGLGLDLAKTIVEAHGGSIRVNSAPQQGSEFIVTIPAAPQECQNEFTHFTD